jgi:hypothetical protein
MTAIEKELPEAPAIEAQPAPAATESLLPSIELFTRLMASVLLLVYGLGFVILGFHDARYGVVQFSPFRARVVLVGFVFLALVSLAAAAQHYGLSYFGPLDPVIKDNEPKRRVQRDIILGTSFIFTAALISATLGNFLFFSFPAAKSNLPGWHFVAGMAIYFSAIGVFTVAAKTYLRKPVLAAFLSLLAFAMVLAAYFAPLFGTFPSHSAYLTLVVTVVGWHSIVVKRWDTQDRPAKFALDYRNWGLILCVLWLYISQVFVAIPPRWGGGQPVPVQIFQNSAAPWSPSNPMDALLLDETDQGLYVLLSPTGKAFFVPRSNIASVFFGSKQDIALPAPRQP